MNRAVCVHGHFYQPPRENPWLEAIELQDSAWPHHDWNERITDECYRPNARSRILDDAGRIVKIVNNYARISFNFGPTLLSWLELHAPDVHAAVLEADRASIDRFSGHGSALAQAYNHSILPLSNERDRRTQVHWGVRDFERRFGRMPEGMWLPETAVNTPTLEALAEAGLRFTILAPRQAAAVRPRRGGRPRVLQGDVDPSRPYAVRLPSGREIAVFFYDGPLSQAVAFEGLLDSGDRFADRLLSGFSDEREGPQLVHIATDGETYGHHHRHGDMALAFALERIERDPDVRLTNYGEFLEQHPPTHVVEIVEDSSWSCVHGVGRWREHCGCHSGRDPQWDQQWRKPLRDALDWLRDSVAPAWEDAAGALFADPWRARDAYIEVLHDRGPEHVWRTLAIQAGRELDDAEVRRGLGLLELQRHAMLMYTSCGWFFDELTGIETVQVMRYAGRVLQLAEDLLGQALEPGFLERLEQARSNLPEHRDGRAVYDAMVRPTFVDLPKVAAHHAISAMFDEEGEEDDVYCYRVANEALHRLEAGRARLHVGMLRLESRITFESGRLCFAVLHLGGHMVNCGVRLVDDATLYDRLVCGTEAPFHRADAAEILRILDDAFGSSSYSLAALFRDEQRRVIDRVLASSLAAAGAGYRSLYEVQAPLLHFLRHLDIPAPAAMRLSAEFVINADLREALAARLVDPDRVDDLLEQARRLDVTLDAAPLGFVFEHALRDLAVDLAADAEDVDLLRRIDRLVVTARALPFEIDPAELQNVVYGLAQATRPRVLAAEGTGDAAAGDWLEAFAGLGEHLGVHVESDR